MSLQRILFTPKTLKFVRPVSCSCARNSSKNEPKLTRNIATIETALTSKEPIYQRILTKIPFLGFKKQRNLAAGYLLYESVADNLNYQQFFDKLSIPDTFYSWFAVTELHLWMLCVRVMAEDADGKEIRNSILEALWADVSQRAKRIGAHNPADTKSQIKELSEQLQASLIAYDEGLQSDDVVLAAAIWRRLYQYSVVDAQNLESLVKYVRKHVTLFDNVSCEKLLTERDKIWQQIG